MKYFAVMIVSLFLIDAAAPAFGKTCKTTCNGNANSGGRTCTKSCY